MPVYRPSDTSQTADLISWAVVQNRQFEVVGGRSKRSLGRPPKSEDVLDVSQLAGISDYEPAELILTAGPGTKLAAIEAELEREGQMLAFEPPRWGDLLRSDGEPTLGGALACNLAGSRRIRVGAARDFLLGLSAVNGRGEIWKAGGKVIKNVTGFDMCKLQSGAFGTLSVLTEVTIKVLPKPEEECTVLFEENSDSVAVIAMAAALNSAFDVSSAAYLPATAARRCALSAISDARGGFTAMRFEGPRPSVAYRVEAIEKRFGRGVRISGFDSSALWSSIREVHSLVPRGEQVIWRLCPTPSLAALVVAEVRARLGSAEVIYDWGGGLVWLSIATEETGDDAGAAVVRSALEKVGGNSTLVVAADDTRERVPVFEPLGGAIAELTRRIKYNFDPNGVLNPGRMQRGI